MRSLFASITITIANSEGNLKEAAVIETSHVTKNPERECITLDRTPSKLGSLFFVLSPTKLRKRVVTPAIVAWMVSEARGARTA